MKADKELVAAGLVCVILAPDIKMAISPMQGKEILNVIHDDPKNIM